MRKNISSLLQKGNLTPKERYLLLIQNDVIRETTGKEPLTEADKKGLESWQPKTEEEEREWNKYSEGWKLSGRAGIETEFIYFQTLANHHRKSFINMSLNFYPLYRDAKQLIKTLEKIKVVDIKEALEITNKQREQKLKDGLGFNYAIYELAFESLSKDLKKNILALYPDAETETDYLDEQKIIADLFNGKDKLTKEAKEKLAELVASKSYNAYAKEYQFYHYFACIPILEVARRWATEKGLKPTRKYSERVKETLGEVAKKVKMSEDEAKERLFLEDELKDILKNYARDNKTTVETILKEVCLKWLDEDLFEQHTPLVICEKELLNKWLKTKDEAKAILKKLIDKGELKVRERTAGETRQDTFISELKEQELHKRVLGKQYTSNKIITGESLYNFKGNYEFIKEFKERVDRYSANDGFVYADDDPEHKGDHLDRELLIADKDKDGRPAIISIFGMSLRKIEGTLKPRYFKEVEKNGETYLEFKSEEIEKVFKETRQSLINGYAKLLAFLEIFKKLSKIYEIDLTFLITPIIKQVSEFIETHNNFLDNALEDALGFGVGFDLYKKPLKTREDLYINKDRIAPDINTTEEYGKEFYEILGDEYKF